MTAAQCMDVARSGRLPEGDQLRAILEHIARNADAVVATYHPLGFIHSKLAEYGNRTLRLHVWGPYGEAQSPAWTVHDHAFSFESLVIAGSITNVYYDFVSSDDAAAGRLYRVEYKERKSVMTPTTRVGRLAVQRSIVSRRNTQYTVHAGQFHETVMPEGTIASTVVLTTSSSRASEPLVVGALKGNGAIHFVRREVPAAIVASAVRLALSAPM